MMIENAQILKKKDIKYTCIEISARGLYNWNL
jgi:hypothetical protein